MKKTKRKHEVCKENFYLLKLLTPLNDLTFEQYKFFCEEPASCCDICSPAYETCIGKDYVDNYMFDVYMPSRQKYLRDMIREAKFWLKEIKKLSPDFDLAFEG